MKTHQNQGLFKLTTLAVVAALTVAACQTRDPVTGETRVDRAATGAGIGVATGAAIGALAGGRKGALIGAGIGTLAGAGVGYYMDQQEKQLRQEMRTSGVEVSRSGDTITLNLPGGITFATDSSDISADFYAVLDSVARVLREHEKTYVDVIGYTDSTGSADYNQRLSEQRAASVARYLESRGILPQRLLVKGMGPTNPLASNATKEGRAQNRRVEIKLSPLV